MLTYADVCWTSGTRRLLLLRPSRLLLQQHLLPP
jgi:hypothetical protein